MKKNIIIYSLFLALPLLTSCKDEITGDFGNFDVKPQIAVESLCEYDSIGKKLIKEYKLETLEEKDTFWLRSYKAQDTIKTEIIKDGEGIPIDTIYTTKDKLVYYNDKSKKARYIHFKSVQLDYSPKQTEIRILLRTNAKWKASEITFSPVVTGKSYWAKAMNTIGSGDSYVRAKITKGLASATLRNNMTQQIVLTDSTVMYQYDIVRKGRDTDLPK